MWEGADEGGRLLDVAFEYSHLLWPWSGYLALYLRVWPAGAAFEGTASGNVRASSAARFQVCWAASYR